MEMFLIELVTIIVFINSLYFFFKKKKVNLANQVANIALMFILISVHHGYKYYHF